MSGANFLAVSSPQFPSAIVRTGAKTLTITAPGASDADRYIQRVKLDGKALGKTWVTWSDIAGGGTLAHTLGSTPSRWGTAAAAQPPSVNEAPADNRTHLDATLTPASAALPAGDTSAAVRFTVDIVAQAPSTITPRVSATAPAGWKVAVSRPRTVASRHLPVSTKATVTVRAPAGVAEGSYPITVTVRGANTVTRTAQVAVREPTTCAPSDGSACPVDLSPERNVDGTATVAAPAEGNFDGGGWSYDAGLLPAAGPVTWGGVEYQAPDPAGTAANFVQARGQAILLPAGAHTAVRLIATAYNGPASGTLTLGYTDGTTGAAAITVADWCGSPAAGSTTALAMPHRIKAGQGVDGPPVSLFGLSVPVPSGKQIRSITLPDDPRLHLYAVTLI
jgi:hypothetical protein